MKPQIESQEIHVQNETVQPLTEEEMKLAGGGLNPQPLPPRRPPPDL
jgi:hypothetical protein